MGHRIRVGGDARRMDMMAEYGSPAASSQDEARNPSPSLSELRA